MFGSSGIRLVGDSVFLLALVPGCHLFCRDRPVSVLARDAETGRPLPDADVKITAYHTKTPFTASDPVAKTDKNGIARLNASPADDFGVTVSVDAAGYLSEEKFLSAKAIEVIEPPPLLFGARAEGPPTLTLALYAGPRPTVELIVPAGYRGVINAEVHAQDNLPSPSGQRCFPSRVSPTGETRLTGPALLQRIDSRDFTAKFADGTPIPRTAKENEVGLWWLESHENRHTFVVGTKEDYDLRKPSSRDRSPEGPAGKPARSGRGGGGRRGGRGGLGSQQSF